MGHVSLWREEDRALVAGDAFITTNQESAYAVAVQKPELHGPPMYYTPDWPALAITGHGRALRVEEMRAALHTLARDFDRIAVPEQGRYVPGSGTEGGG